MAIKKGKKNENSCGCCCCGNVGIIGHGILLILVALAINFGISLMNVLLVLGGLLVLKGIIKRVLKR